MSRPLYCTGIVRCGTTFLARMLSAHAQIKLASDPLLPLFRALRTRIARTRVDPDFDRDQPLDDYYFSPEKLRLMKAVQAADLDLPFPQDQLGDLIDELAARMALAAEECLPRVGGLQGQTFRELFANCHRMIEETYEADDIAWSGIKDNWIIEFLPLIARAFPRARFIVIMRDPRAVAASALKLRESDPTLVPLLYSLVRHWRKHAAFATKLQAEPLFEERLFVLRYEDLVTAPRETAQALCEFLQVDDDPNMLDTTKYRGVTEEQWSSWSSFDVPKQGIYADSTTSWQKYLPAETIEFVEFVCEPEMRLFRYEPAQYKGSLPTEAVMRTFVEDDRIAQGWRGRHLPWHQEHAYELFRKQMLTFSPQAATTEMIEIFFLFEEVYEKAKV